MNANASAEVVLTGGKVSTMCEAPKAPREPEGLAISGDRIIAVGSSMEMLSLAGPQTRQIDLHGRRVIPGLIDAHVHFARAGFTWNEEIRWGTVRTLKEGLERITARAKTVPAGTWINVIGGWHRSQFDERRDPTIAELDQAAPDHPVLVQFLYDWGLLNQKGRDSLPFDRAISDGVDPKTLELDSASNPTGKVSTLPSLRWLFAQLPKPTLEQQVSSTAAAGLEFARFGLTGVIDGGGTNTGPDVYGPLYETWRREKLVPRVRLTMHSGFPGDEEKDLGEYLRNLHPRQGDDMLQVLGIGEIVMWPLHDGFARLPDLSSVNQRRLETLLRDCANRGWTVQMHLIRPETTDVIVDMWSRIHADIGIDHLRWSIVHGESVSDHHVEKLAAMGAGVIAEALLRLVGDSALRAWGPDRLAFAPSIQRLRAGGVRVAIGSDGLRGATHNPFAALHWLVTGRSLKGTQIWHPDNVLDRHTALSLMTAEAAWFSFEDHLRGRISPGYLADIAVLSDDYFSVSQDQLLDIRSDLTMVGGKIVWNTLTSDGVKKRDGAAP